MIRHKPITLICYVAHIMCHNKFMALKLLFYHQLTDCFLLNLNNLFIDFIYDLLFIEEDY